jgi:hypothetical protein
MKIYNTILRRGGPRYQEVERRGSVDSREVVRGSAAPKRVRNTAKLCSEEFYFSLNIIGMISSGC